MCAKGELGVCVGVKDELCVEGEVCVKDELCVCVGVKDELGVYVQYNIIIFCFIFI